MRYAAGEELLKRSGVGLGDWLLTAIGVAPFPFVVGSGVTGPMALFELGMRLVAMTVYLCGLLAMILGFVAIVSKVVADSR